MNVVSLFSHFSGVFAGLMVYKHHTYVRYYNDIINILSRLLGG